MMQVNIRLHLDEFTTIVEFVLHQFGVVCGEQHFHIQIWKRSFQSTVTFKWSPTKILQP